MADMENGYFHGYYVTVYCIPSNIIKHFGRLTEQMELWRRQCNHILIQ